MAELVKSNLHKCRLTPVSYIILNLPDKNSFCIKTCYRINLIGDTRIIIADNYNKRFAIRIIEHFSHSSKTIISAAIKDTVFPRFIKLLATDSVFKSLLEYINIIRMNHLIAFFFTTYNVIIIKMKIIHSPL